MKPLILLSLFLGVVVGGVFGQLQFGDEKKEEKKVDSRLGLLAETLGVDPVPGASYQQDPTKGDYTNGPIHGGNNPQACRCVPRQYCGRPGGVHGGNNGGGTGTYPPNNGGGTGTYPPNNGGGTGTYPPNQPIQGGNQGGGQGSYPGNKPVQGGNGNYGPVHGGNGGGGTGSYPGTDPGLTTGQYGQQQTNPAVDGAGNIDIRIVNNPPGGPGGPGCQSGEVYCCDNGEGNAPIKQGSCGVARSINVPGYIPVYGQADFGEYPWMAVILGKANNYIGAGALIDSYHILTAAHKVQDWKPGFYMKVRLGEWNAKDDNEPYKNVEIDVERIELHPSFNPHNLQNDVAIVRLAQPIDPTAFPHINTACLPDNGVNFVGTRCWVAGFGKDAFGNGKHSYILKEVDVPIVDGTDCENRLKGTRLGNYFTLNRKSFLCAGGEEGKDACTGDGGAPLVCQYGGRYQVVGLVAWGIGCADYGVPGVYVNVQNYLKWIESRIGPQYPNYDERNLKQPV